jgi:hypothetical protein
MKHRSNLNPGLLQGGLCRNILFTLVTVACCFYLGCKKKSTPAPASITSKIGGMRQWRGTYQYGWWEANHVEYGQFYSEFSRGFTDSFAFVASNDSVVEIINNKELNIDTSVFKLFQKDTVTLRFALVRNVTSFNWVFSPYNSFPDTVIYYYTGDSIHVFSGNVNGGYYADFIYMTTQ